MHALDNPLLIDPAPASAVFVEYFESSDGSLRVRVLFNNDTWKFSNRKPLFFNHVEQAEDGSMTADEFKKFITRKVDSWDSKFPRGDVPEKCATPWPQIDPSKTDFWAPPEAFRKALYHHYGISPVLPPAAEVSVDPQLFSSEIL